MSAVAFEVTSRGVSCRYCGKPIRLSTAMAKRQAAIKSTETTQNPDLVTKVFQARCRRCHKESLYALEEIADFTESRTDAGFP